MPTAANSPPETRGTYRLPNGLPVFYLGRIDTESVYQEIFDEDVYRQHGIRIRDGDCIFDIGANTGLFVVFLNQICERATVFSFEPIPATYEVARRNVELHSKLDVTLLNMGMSREPGTATFTFYPRISCASTMYPDDSDDERRQTRDHILWRFGELSNRPLAFLLSCCPNFVRYAVAGIVQRYFGKRRLVSCRLTTVSEIIREHGVERIDLLKLDAERSELEVLAGISEADWPKIRQAIVETHSGEEARKAVENLLTRQGYRVVAEQNLQFPKVYLVYAVRQD